MFGDLRRNRFLVPGIAAVAAFAFLLANNYCVCEAFSGEHSHAENADQHAAASHHDESSSNNAYDPCCSTLQAIGTSQAALILDGPAQLFFHVIRPQHLQLASIELPLTASGLSPPAREPTPVQPFYRTTFANHAPPIYLA